MIAFGDGLKGEADKRMDGSDTTSYSRVLVFTDGVYRASVWHSCSYRLLDCFCFFFAFGSVKYAIAMCIHDLGYNGFTLLTV